MKTSLIAFAALALLATSAEAKIIWPCVSYDTNYNDNLDTHCLGPNPGGSHSTPEVSVETPPPPPPPPNEHYCPPKEPKETYNTTQ